MAEEDVDVENDVLWFSSAAEVRESSDFQEHAQLLDGSQPPLHEKRDAIPIMDYRKVANAKVFVMKVITVVLCC